MKRTLVSAVVAGVLFSGCTADSSRAQAPEVSPSADTVAPRAVSEAGGSEALRGLWIPLDAQGRRGEGFVSIGSARMVCDAPGLPRGALTITTDAVDPLLRAGALTLADGTELLLASGRDRMPGSGAFSEWLSVSTADGRLVLWRSDALLSFAEQPRPASVPAAEAPAQPGDDLRQTAQALGGSVPGWTERIIAAPDAMARQQVLRDLNLTRRRHEIDLLEMAWTDPAQRSQHLEACDEAAADWEVFVTLAGRWRPSTP